MSNTAHLRGEAPASGQTERCVACGWTLTVLRGHPTAKLFHPLRCPRCGGSGWTARGTPRASRVTRTPEGHA